MLKLFTGAVSTIGQNNGHPHPPNKHSWPIYLASPARKPSIKPPNTVDDVPLFCPPKMPFSTVQFITWIATTVGSSPHILLCQYCSMKSSPAQLASSDVLPRRACWTCSWLHHLHLVGPRWKDKKASDDKIVEAPINKHLWKDNTIYGTTLYQYHPWRPMGRSWGGRETGGSGNDGGGGGEKGPDSHFSWYLISNCPVQLKNDW